MEIAARAPVISEVVGRGLEAGDAGVARKISARKIAGGIGVVNGEDLRLSTASEGNRRGGRGALNTALGEGEYVGGAAQGGELSAGKRYNRCQWWKRSLRIGGRSEGDNAI